MPGRMLQLFYYGPVILWMALIFLGSTQIGSSVQSYRLVVRLVRLLTPDEAAGASSESLHKLDRFARKIAHITEYAVLTLLTARAAQFGRRTLRMRSLPGCAAFCVLYAATDELHQAFVPGRSALPRDVLIDSVGVAISLAALLCWNIVKSLEQQLWNRLNSEGT